MVLALLLVVARLSPSAGDSLYGVVRSTPSGEPIPGVQVSVLGQLGVLTDSAGRYSLPDLPAGRREVRFTRMGFEPLAVSVLLASGAPTRVDVDLTPVPLSLPAVSVRPFLSLPDPGVRDTIEISGLRLDQSLVARNPLLEDPDLFAAAAAATFISGRDELTPTLRVRGGAGDQNLVLVDGLPWRGPRPPGGIAGPLPTSALASVDVHVTALPARYGNALSSTIVVRPKPAAHFLAAGVMDGSMVEQTVGGPLPLGGATLLLGGRWTYRSVFNRPDDNGESENGFGNGFGRLSFESGIGGIDLYYLDARHQLAFPVTGSSTALNHFAAVGSLTGAIWTRDLAPGRALHARVWYESVGGSADWDRRSGMLTSRLRDAGVSAEYASGPTELGFTFGRTATSYRVQDTSAAPFTLTGAPVVTAAFVNRRWSVPAGGILSGGVRVSALGASSPRLEPRLVITEPLSAGVTVSFAYARIYQYVQSARNEESPIDAVLGMDLPVAVAGGLRPARSDQVTATLEAHFNERASLVVEGYSRRLSNLALVAPGTTAPFATGAIARGSGSSQGLEATLIAQGERLDVRVQAGVLSTLRTVDTIRYRPGGDEARMALGVGYHLAHATTLRLAAFAGAGRPTTPLAGAFELDPYAPLDGGGALSGTPVTVAGPVNDARLPLYARVDLGLTREWELPPRGAGARVSTSLTVLNLFDRRNVLAYVATPDGQRPVYLLTRTVSLRLHWYLDTD